VASWPAQVLPLLRVHCSAEEQRALVFQSLLVMPLSLLETVLPWLHAHLSPDEAKQVIENMSMAGETPCPTPSHTSSPLLLAPTWQCYHSAAWRAKKGWEIMSQ